MSKIKRLITLLLLILLINQVYFTARVFAETRTSGTLSVTGNFPVLTSSDGVWYPGKTIIKPYIVKNSGGIAQDFAVKATSLSDPDFLAPHLFMDISGGSSNYFGTKDTSGNALSGASIKSFYDLTNTNELVLFSLPAGGEKTVSYTFTMDPALENGSYQNKNLSFDLAFGYSVSASPTPTPTQTPGPTETPVPGPTGTPGPGPTSTPAPGGGVVAGAQLTAGGLMQQVLGALETLPANILGAQAGTVSGVSTGSGKLGGGAGCRNLWWWMIVLILESAITAALVFYGRKKGSLKYLLVQGAAALSGIIISGILFCVWWGVIITGLVGIIGIILLVV